MPNKFIEKKIRELREKFIIDLDSRAGQGEYIGEVFDRIEIFLRTAISSYRDEILKEIPAEKIIDMDMRMGEEERCKRDGFNQCRAEIIEKIKSI